jgi:translation initiation factor IF-1
LEITLAFFRGWAHVTRHSELLANFSRWEWSIVLARFAWSRRKFETRKPGQSGAANSLLALAMSHSNTVSAEQSIELEGTIQTVLPGTMFRVLLDNQHQVLAHISGKMRRHFVRLTVGDRVRIEMSPYDLSKARITYRLR